MEKRIYVIFLVGALFVAYFPSATSQEQMHLSGGQLAKIHNYSMTITPTFFNSTQDKYLQFRFYDPKNNETIQHVSFFLNVTKDDQKLMFDHFHTHGGIAKLKFEPGGRIGNWTVKADKEPVLGSWVNDTGSIDVHSPIFGVKGSYHIHVTLLGADYDNAIFTSDMVHAFDYYVTVGKDAISPPLEQLESGISAENVQCKQDYVLVVKKGYEQSVCVKPQTAENLVKRGWGMLIADDYPR